LFKERSQDSDAKRAVKNERKREKWQTRETANRVWLE